MLLSILEWAGYLSGKSPMALWWTVDVDGWDTCGTATLLALGWNRRMCLHWGATWMGLQSI